MAELLLAKDELGASDSGFSILVAIYGIGFIGGSVGGGARGSRSPCFGAAISRACCWRLSARGQAASPRALFSQPSASCGAGYGAGLLLVHERLLIQATRAGRSERPDLRDARCAHRVGVGDRLRRRSGAAERHRNAGDGRPSGRGRAGGLAGCGGRPAPDAELDAAPVAQVSTGGGSWPRGCSRGLGALARTARTSSAAETAAERPRTTVSTASTTPGSNWVPELALQLCDRLFGATSHRGRRDRGHRVVRIAAEDDPRRVGDLLDRRGRPDIPCRPSARDTSERSRRLGRAGRRRDRA